MNLEEKKAYLRKLRAKNQPQVDTSMESSLTSEGSTPVNQAEGPGIGQQLLGGVQAVGEFYDKFTGAPTRSAISAYQNDRPVVEAFTSQFGEDPTKAPTGKDIAMKAGFSDKSLAERVPESEEKMRKMSLWKKLVSPEQLKIAMGKLPGVRDISPASAAGLGVDIAADPANIIPVGAAAKGAAKLGLKAGKGALKGVGKSIPLAAKGVDLATGTKGAGNLVKGATGMAEDAADAIKSRFSPKRAPDYDEMVAIAKANNIDPGTLPEAVEFGKESFISRASRKEAEGVLGEPMLRKHEAAVDQVNNAFRKKVDSLSSQTMLPEEAGRHIRQSYDDALDELFKQTDVTYSTVAQQAPNLNLRELGDEGMEMLRGFNKKVNALEKKAEKMIKFGVKNRRAQGKQLRAVAERLRESDGNVSVMVDQMREIGEEAFKSKNALDPSPPDIKSLKSMYHDISDILTDTTRGVMGDEVADDLIMNNKRMADFFGDKSVVGKVIGGQGIADEKVFKQLIESGDSKKIDALFGLLGPERVKDLKGAFVNSLIKENIEGGMSFRGVFNQLRNKRVIAEKLLSPQELVELQDILKLGDRMGIPILSTSGTGASQSFGSVVKELPESMVNRQIIDKMKGAARGVTEAPVERPMIPRRSPIEMGAKGAQTYSVQKENKRREKIKRYKDLIRINK